MTRAALRNLLAHKTRLLMTALAIVLGIAFVSGTLVFSDTVGNAYRGQLTQSLDGVAAKVGPGHGGAMGGDRSGGRVDSAAADSVGAVSGVAAVRPVVAGNAYVADGNGAPVGGDRRGNDGTNYHPGPGGTDPRYPLKEGRGPRNAHEVALEVRTARNAGVKVGETVRLSVNGLLLHKELVGLVASNDPRTTAGGSLALFDTATAQKLWHIEGGFHALDVAADPGIPVQDLVRGIREALSGEDLDVRGAHQLAAEGNRTIDELTRGIRQTFLVFAGIALFVGVFVIANTFSILIAQRGREIALLRAVGASRRQVARAVLAEAAILGLGASTVGLGAGVGLSLVLRAVLNATGAQLPDGPLAVSPSTVLTALAVGVGVTVLAAWLPSLKAARIAPVEALNAVETLSAPRGLAARNALGAVLTLLGVSLMLYVHTRSDTSGLAWAMLGGVLTMSGVIVLAPLLARPVLSLGGTLLGRLLGVSGRLAKANVLRNPRRTAATASALMIGLCLMTGLSVVRASAEPGIDRRAQQDLRADYQVSLRDGPPSGLAPHVQREIVRLPGVEAAPPFRRIQVTSGGTVTELVGTDVTAIGKVARLRFLGGSAAAVRDDVIAVAETAAREHAWKAGDRVLLEFSNGKRAQVTVGALYADNDVIGPMLATTRFADRYTDEPGDTKLLVKAAPGRAEGLDQEIRNALGGDPALSVQSRDDLRRDTSATISAVFDLAYGLLGMAVVIAVVGVVGTLTMSVFERTREVGTLRAIGLARGQVRQMVRLESVMIALFGALLGIGTGVFLAWSGAGLLRTSFPEYSTTLPWRVIILSLLTAPVIGVAAAVWPAHRAARQNPLEAIGKQ
ncbi:ABC transporter permease [Streptomyces lavendulae]|uniref:ABC transporter permease n=1 Tax=Streptomyces lavendulae TaxID=1914 RepID=UPI00380A5182